MNVRAPFGLQTVAAVQVRDAGNVLRDVSQIVSRNPAGMAKVVYSTFAAVVSPMTAQGFGNSTGAITISTNSVTLSPSSGTAPYTVAWNFSDVIWSEISPNSLTTAFRATGVSAGDSVSTTAYATVTDANGKVAESPVISLFATNTNGS